MNAPVPEILLIDDEQDKLESLAARVQAEVGADIVEQWNPVGDENPSAAFKTKAGEDTVLVVTDYDLTTAVKGLFGHSVVAWCRNRFIPAGDFSRGHLEELPEEPDLFKLRVPRDEVNAASYIVRMYDGFRQIQQGIENNPGVLSGGHSPAEVLAALLDRPNLESQLGPYLSRPGLFNASLLDTLTSAGHGNGGATTAEKKRLLTYILGHVLVNAVLKYPGPILAEGPLCAYVAASAEDIDTVSELIRRG